MTSSPSFITQCSRCATKFKVTQEQLNVSEGWVRCGRCDHIFDAQSQLIDGAPVQHVPLAAAQQEPATPTPSAPASAPIEAAPGNAIPEPVSAALASEKASDSQHPANTEAGARPSERWLKELSDTFSPSEINPVTAADAKAQAAQPSTATPDPAPTDAAADTTANAPAATPQEPVSAPVPTVAPQASNDTQPPETDAHDNDIASFHDELAQWRAKRNPSPDTPAEPAQVASSAGADTESIQTTNDATEAAPATSAPDERVHAAPAASDAAETDAQRVQREEEERLERYRAEFSETQELRFMREAEQKAFWRRPVLRLFMAVLALLLLTLLAAQWAYVQRDAIAALSPQWKDRMQQACSWIGCRITPLQSIEDLVLDGSTFQHVGQQHYTLSWTVRNRSNRWIETPALSLSLRNAAGETLVRRTIAVGEIAQTPPQLAPGSSWKAQQHLQLNGYADAITGYQLQIFYPDAVD